MTHSPGTPADLDDATLLRVARSFYVVKMARYGALLVALGVVLAAALASDTPRAVAAVVGVLVALLALGALQARRRYLIALRRSPASSPSPRA